VAVLQSCWPAYGDREKARRRIGRRAVFVVGDPEESIYRFRRAAARLRCAPRLAAPAFGARAPAHHVTRRNGRLVTDVLTFDAAIRCTRRSAPLARSAWGLRAACRWRADGGRRARRAARCATC